MLEVQRNQAIESNSWSKFSDLNLHILPPVCTCLQWLQRTSGGATYIATLPWIALLALSVSIELVSSSARVTSVKSQQGRVS